MTFLNYALERMVEPDNLLVKVDSIIDLVELSTLLDKKLGTQSKIIAGQESYNYLSMFKVLLLQQWHTLSDPKMEDALKTRIDFMWFTGLGLSNKEYNGRLNSFNFLVEKEI